MSEYLENEKRWGKQVADFIDDHGMNCDCCQHVMIDVTSALTQEKQHCIAGDSEGEGVACGFGWHSAPELSGEPDPRLAELIAAAEGILGKPIDKRKLFLVGDLAGEEVARLRAALAALREVKR